MRFLAFNKLEEKMSKITESARNQPCLVRIPSICNFDPSTTVLAHLNGGGIGMKTPDIHGAYACSACHDAIDGRIKTPFSPDELELMHRQGVERTINLLIAQRLVMLAD